MIPGMRRSPLLIAALGLCCSSTDVVVLAADVSAIEQAIEQCVEADMAAIDAPGAAVTVVNQGDVIFNRGFGVKRRNASQPVDSATRFRIGSVTKMFTAAAVMQQVDSGAMNLDDPVSTWVPELSLSGQWPAGMVTVRHLLTHTAALPDHYEDALGPTGDQALSNWAAGLDDVELHAPPGTFWNYSNPGYSLAGLVAERSSGLPYRELMSDRLFQPAGMPAATFDPADVIESNNYSWGHHPAPDGTTTIYAPDDYESWIGSPAGQAFSTAEELASWALLLIDGGGDVLTPSSAAAMQARQVSLDRYPAYDYGLGIFAEVYKGLDVRQHGGNIYGWGAWLMWVPERRFVVSILDNTTYYLRDAAYCILDAVLEPEPEEPPDYTTDPATWVAYTGSYELMDNTGDAFQAEVELVGDRLFAVFPNPSNPSSPTIKELTQLYLDTFSMEAFDPGDRDFELTFIRRDTHLSTRMWLRNQWFVGLRIPRPRGGGGRLVPKLP